MQQALIDALETKFADSTAWADVGGRVFYRKATSPAYPRIVYSFISANPDNVFARKGESVLMQVDIFTADSAGDDFANTIYADTRSLLDDWEVTVAGTGKFEFTWENTVSLSEDVDVGDGTVGISHIAVDYSVSFQAT